MTLQAEHRPEAIRERLEAKKQHNYLGDAVLGAIDGCVTTFAIVAGAIGGKLSPGIALLLGLANLFADGFSMAVGNYQKAKSERDLLQKIRRTEERHIDHVPDGEKEEIRQLYGRKGFSGSVLNKIVETITADKKMWVDTMIVEEYGLPLETANPIYAGLITFIAFLLVGCIPVAPLLFSGVFGYRALYATSVLSTGVAFFGVGFLKGLITENKPFTSGSDTFFTGGIAALLAYFVGYFLRALV